MRLNGGGRPPRRKGGVHASRLPRRCPGCCGKPREIREGESVGPEDRDTLGRFAAGEHVDREPGRSWRSLDGRQPGPDQPLLAAAVAAVGDRDRWLPAVALVPWLPSQRRVVSMTGVLSPPVTCGTTSRPTTARNRFELIASVAHLPANGRRVHRALHRAVRPASRAWCVKRPAARRPRRSSSAIRARSGRRRTAPPARRRGRRRRGASAFGEATAWRQSIGAPPLSSSR